MALDRLWGASEAGKCERINAINYRFCSSAWVGPIRLKTVSILSKGVWPASDARGYRR